MMQLARTVLAEKRIIAIFARCMTNIDKRKEVQSLRTELKAHDLDFGQLGQSHREARGGSTFSAVSFVFTRRAREHRGVPEVLIFVCNSVEHPVVERCFYFSPAPRIPQDNRLNPESRSSASPRESMTCLRTSHHEHAHMFKQTNVKHCL